MCRHAELEDGFTLLEALIGLVFSAFLAALVLQLLGSDVPQVQRFIGRNEASVSLAHAQRAFVEEAAYVSGAANETTAGNLSIYSDRLIIRGAGRERTLYRWRNGRAAFAFSNDGRNWRSTTSSAEQDVIRFRWSDGSREISWWTP